MNAKTIKVACCGLLYKIGKLINTEALKDVIVDEEILDAILHSNESISACNHLLPSNSLAYLIKMADRIITRSELRLYKDTDVRQESDNTVNPSIPLYSVFNKLNRSKTSSYYHLTPMTEKINYPDDKPGYVLTTYDYEALTERLSTELAGISCNEKSINTLLSILETNLSFLPSNTYHMDTADIPLYDYCKLTAAIASCIHVYLNYHNRMNYSKEFVDDNNFNTEKVFLMFSGDFSGIQSFIYNIVSDGALKSLRSRSFFLELIMEHIVDEILEASGVTRANLIYSGGGHCYILLPNTKEVIERIESLLKFVNKWIRKAFGTRLYFAYGYTECSANDLMNLPYEDAPYEQIFLRLSRLVSQRKMHRYTVSELLELNTPSICDGERECKICGTEDHLVNEDNICHWCYNFEKLSQKLIQDNLVLLITDKSISDLSYFKLPSLSGETFCYFVNESEADKLINEIDIKRIYTKNKTYSNLPNSTRLYMGDYLFDTRIEKLIGEQEIQKIAVLRGDVDNLGQAFISGFTRQSADPKIRNQYNTLSRTAVFSRQMSLFFKYHLNYLLAGNEETFNIPIGNEQSLRKRVVTVYSGGDDVFLIGNIKDILETAILIQDAFSRYTCNTLNISLGLGMYPTKYPIYRSAIETEELETLAKKNDGKNSISLFSLDEKHTYKLNIFKSHVIEEKLSQLLKFFEYNKGSHERGTSFLYQLMEYIKGSEDRINIARYAYLLARLEPGSNDKEYHQLYKDFSKLMYDWILNPQDRYELLTAIYIYIYLTRKRSEQ